MMAWMLLLNYLKYATSFNLMNLVLFKASHSIFYFIIGCLPLFFGFSYLCQVVFINVPKFGGLLLACQSLFSLSLGDSVRDFFSDTLRSGFLGHFVLILYLLVFFTAVQNIFIALITESYEQVIQ